MSLIQAVITNDFILLGADKRGIKPNGEIMENCNKLIKLNNNIIFGCTGGVMDNFKLFNGFCCYSEEFGFYNTEQTFTLSYNNFIEIISENFQSLYYEYMTSQTKKQYDICSAVCGFNGEKFEVTIFTLGSQYDVPIGITKVHKPDDFPHRGVILGDKTHTNNFDKYFYESYKRFGNLTILHYKNIMKNVCETGSKTDNTINANICFEKIKRKEIFTK